MLGAGMLAPNSVLPFSEYIRMTMFHLRAPVTVFAVVFCLTAGTFVSSALSQTQGRTQAALPNSATALSEDYQDWRVACGLKEKQRVCMLTQQQRKTDTKQLVLAIELAFTDTGSLAGNLVLPFGLDLAKSVTLQSGEGQISKALPFSTCLPSGCFVRINLNEEILKDLKGGQNLKVAAKPESAAKPENAAKNLVLDISAAGFAAAYQRYAAMTAR